MHFFSACHFTDRFIDLLRHRRCYRSVLHQWDDEGKYFDVFCFPNRNPQNFFSETTTGLSQWSFCLLLHHFLDFSTSLRSPVLKYCLGWSAVASTCISLSAFTRFSSNSGKNSKTKRKYNINHQQTKFKKAHRRTFFEGLKEWNLDHFWRFFRYFVALRFHDFLPHTIL